jgi:hypothetical protein
MSRGILAYKLYYGNSETVNQQQNISYQCSAEKGICDIKILNW